MGGIENYFESIGRRIPGSEKGNLFGKPCFKINGKAFTCFFQDEMVFKLSGDDHDEAMSQDGSKLFDPSGKGRPMKEWVQMPYDYREQWSRYAKSAAEYVGF